jgi:hypothetical protein
MKEDELFGSLETTLASTLSSYVPDTAVYAVPTSSKKESQMLVASLSRKPFFFLDLGFCVH